MWIKKPLEEIECESIEKQRKRRRWRFLGPCIGALLIATLNLFVRLPSRLQHAYGNTGLVPLDQIPGRIPHAIFMGMGFWPFFYLISKWQPETKISVICPKCEAVKFADEFPQCKCGGRFEKIEEMKWVH